MKLVYVLLEYFNLSEHIACNLWGWGNQQGSFNNNTIFVE